MSTSWALTGNAGTNPATDFIGTTDSQPLVVKSDGKEIMRVTPVGVGVGTIAPLGAVHVVSAPGTSTNNGIVIEANSGTGSTPRLGLVDTVNTSGPTTAPTWFVDNAADNFRIFRQPNVSTGGSVLLSIDSTGELHAVTSETNNGVLIIANSKQGSTPRLGLLDNAAFNGLFLGAPAPAGNTIDTPVWFVDNAADTFRIFRQPNVSTPGVAYLSIDNTGTVSVVQPPTATGGIASNGILVEANSSQGNTPRLGLVDSVNTSGPTAAPAWFLDNAGDNFRIFRQPTLSTPGFAYLSIDNSGTVHVFQPPTGPGTSTNNGVLIEGDSSQGSTPRLGLVDTVKTSSPTAAPAWFLDNAGDNFRIFRQPTVSTPGAVYHSIDNSGNHTITGNVAVSGNHTVSGDITLIGADCADHFDVTGPIVPEPGTVLVIDKEGSLRESCEAYDKKVAGVVSGAGEYRHGILLDGRESDEPRVALALTGKVYCKVDAQFSPVEVGDLLTTSPTPGHAMKATAAARAFGAVIGKALRALERGQGLVPILVSLQ